MKMTLLSMIRKSGGFTLSELMVVIVITGVMATLAIPRYQGMVEHAHAQDGTQVLITVLASQNRYFMENGVYDGGGGTDLPNSNLDVTFTNINNFNTPLVYSDVAVGGSPNVVVSIERSGGSTPYRLMISSAGQITCDDGGGSPASICTSFGY